jgi:hypothetical protein
VVFVQVIQGQVADAGKIWAALDWWIQKLAPHRSAGLVQLLG